MRQFFKLFVPLILLSGAAFGQVNIIINKTGSPNILTQEPNRQIQGVFIIPIYADTAAALTKGIDSLGMVIQIRGTGIWYKRDTSAGTHKWTPFSSGGGGSTDTISLSNRINQKKDNSDTVGLSGYRSVGSANKTRDSLAALISSKKDNSDTVGLSGYRSVGSANKTRDSLAVVFANANNLSSGSIPTGRFGAATIPHSAISATAVTPGSYTNPNLTVAADGTITAASNGTGGGGGSSGNADSIKKDPIDTTGMRNGDVEYYDYPTKTHKYKQSSTDREQYLGTLYQNGGSMAADFTASGVTMTTVGGKMQLTPVSSGTYTANVNLTAYGYTLLPHHRTYIKGVLKFTPTTTSYGLGFGLLSAAASSPLNCFSIIDTRSNQTLPMTLYGGASLTSPTALTGGTSVSVGSAAPASGDTVELIFERNLDSIYTTFRDIQQNCYRHYRYGYNLTSGSVANMPNVSTFSFFMLGTGAGTLEVDSMSVTSDEIKNAQSLLWIDSKGIYWDSAVSNSIAYKLNQRIPTVVNYFGPGNTTADMLKVIPEVKRLSPKNAMIAFSSNDKRFGVPDATGFANLKKAYDSIVTFGIRPIMLLPFFETSIDLSAYTGYELATFPASQIIDTWSPIKSNPAKYLNTDLIHPGILGADTLATTILKSYKVPGGIPITPGFIQNNFTTTPQNAAINISGNIASTGKGNFGSSSFGTADFPLSLKTATDKNIKMYQGTNMNIGAFIDAGTAGIPMALQFGKLTLSAWYGSTDHPIVTIDTIETASGGHVLIGTTTADATDAPFEVSTNRAVTGSFNSTNATGNGFAISNSNTVALYLGTGGYTTGAALGDATIRSNVTGVTHFSVNGGTEKARLDNEHLNLGTSFTTVPSALLNLTTTTQGVLFPRMTLANFTAIGSKATGLHAQLTDSANKLGYYDGSKIVMYATTDQLAASGGAGISRVALIDSLTRSANGSQVSGISIVEQTANASFPGLVSTGAQTFGGVKTMPAPIFTALTSAGVNDSVLCINPSTGQITFTNRNANTNIANAGAGTNILFVNSGVLNGKTLIVDGLKPTSNTDSSINIISNPVGFVATADQTITNSTSLTSAAGTGVGSQTIPASYLKAGTNIHIKGYGFLSTAVTAPSLAFQVSVGVSSAAGFASTLPISLSQAPMEWDFSITIRTTGVSGTMMIDGSITVGSTVSYIATSSPYTIDTTSSALVDLKFQFGTASTSNTILSQIYNMQVKQ